MVAIFVAVVLAWPAVVQATDAFPLRPPDRSSPRASLEGFTKILDEAYQGFVGVLTEYAASGRLYLSQEESRRQREILGSAPKAVQYLDLSHISAALRDAVAIERILQLKEILDRIALPAPDAIPDQAAVARTGAKRWRLPDTEIDLVLMEDGPQRGEFLVSADTVDRLPEFYNKAKEFPYKSGPAEQLSATYRALSQERTDTIYDAFLNSPAGLAHIVPPRWLLSLPDWAKFRFAGAIAWQWLGLGFGLLLTVVIISGAARLAKHLTSRNAEDDTVHWQMLPVPLVLLLLSGLLIPLLCTILRIGGTPRIAITLLQSGAFYLGAAWLAIVGSIVLGEIIVGSEHMKRGSLDSQLILLATRLGVS